MGQHSDSDVARLLPLMPRDYLILFALVSEARHGYGIIHQVEEATGGDVRLDPANLYRVVKRLHREGLIAETKHAGDEEAIEVRRRFWAITPFGRRTVAAEASRLARLASLARSSGLIPQHDS